MARVCFPYRLEKSKLVPEGTLPRPVAEVEVLARSGQWLKFAPYVDSGADITLFPGQAGDPLGLDVTAGEEREVTGVGGAKLKVYIHTLRMRLAGVEFEARIGFALAEDLPYLLGRLDVFDRFYVTFGGGQICFEARRG